VKTLTEPFYDDEFLDIISESDGKDFVDQIWHYILDRNNIIQETPICRWYTFMQSSTNRTSKWLVTCVVSSTTLIRKQYE